MWRSGKIHKGEVICGEDQEAFGWREMFKNVLLQFDRQIEESTLLDKFFFYLGIVNNSGLFFLPHVKGVGEKVCPCSENTDKTDENKILGKSI